MVSVLMVFMVIFLWVVSEGCVPSMETIIPHVTITILTISAIMMIQLIVTVVTVTLTAIMIMMLSTFQVKRRHANLWINLCTPPTMLSDPRWLFFVRCKHIFINSAALAFGCWIVLDCSE